MSRNAYDVVSDLLLLDLPFVNFIIRELDSAQLYNVMFNRSDERIELLCGILSYIDNDLEFYFDSLAKPEQLLKELTEMYIGMGFINRSEESFITGNMDLETQCNVWLQIISCLKTFCQQRSSDLNDKHARDRKDFRILVNNPHMKRIFKCKIIGNVKNKPNGKIDRDAAIKELEEIDITLQNLEEKMVCCLSEQELSEESGLPLNKLNLKNVNIERLLNEWSDSIQNWWRTHCEIRDHHSYHSSGYESCLDSFSVTKESDLEDSIQRGLTETIHSLYNSFKNTSELISCLKGIRMESRKILARTEGQDCTAKLEGLLSSLSNLRH